MAQSEIGHTVASNSDHADIMQNLKGRFETDRYHTSFDSSREIGYFLFEISKASSARLDEIFAFVWVSSFEKMKRGYYIRIIGLSIRANQLALVHKMVETFLFSVQVIMHTQRKSDRSDAVSSAMKAKSSKKTRPRIDSDEAASQSS
ncbi:MAG: hypothetical protein F6K19_51940 [Cyanothece sp. SIO1E1]|nr:hypothetical protein [Cyanothece sp. SIO1E1]